MAITAKFKVRLGLTLGVLALAGLVSLSGRRAAPPLGKDKTGTKETSEPEPGPTPTERGTARAPAAPSHYFLSAGLAPLRGPRCDVNVETGRLTVFERDLTLEEDGFALVRARASDDMRVGLFGAGWRTDLEARV